MRGGLCPRWKGESKSRSGGERKGEVVGLSIMDRCQAMFCSMGDDVEPFFLLLALLPSHTLSSAHRLETPGNPRREGEEKKKKRKKEKKG